MTRPCGCKGVRTCLTCETMHGATRQVFDLEESDCLSYVYCPFCKKGWPGWTTDVYLQHPNHVGTPLDFPGIYIQLDFVSAEEEMELLKDIDDLPWVQSQSGRRKQNFGPKCNFKRRKVKPDGFSGFPASTAFLQARFQSVKILKDFFTVEQCSLEYSPDRGASIDPHIDDCWVWGERIVGVNLGDDSVLTMTPYEGTTDKYNLHDVATYPKVVNAVEDYRDVSMLWKCDGGTDDNFSVEAGVDKLHGSNEYKLATEIGKVLAVRIPMPKRSLLVFYGEPRYTWEHRVLRCDIKNRRICLAYREFTPTFLGGGKQADIGRNILELATLTC